MVFRPIRVLVATAALTIFGYAAMFFILPNAATMY